MRPRFISSLADLAGDYDALLCDAWGVIHNGVQLTPGIAHALTQFRDRRGPVVILTNAPKPSDTIPPQLDRLGLARGAYDAIVTSGDATRDAIGEFLPKPAYRLGPDYDDVLYQGLDINWAPLDEASFIVCTGLLEAHPNDPEAHRPLLEAGAARGLPMICANPDTVVNYGGRILICAGALAEIYQSLGGAVTYGGKPHARIYASAMDRVSALLGDAVERRRVLAVGDSVATDIAGANANGFDAVFITGAGGVNDEINNGVDDRRVLEDQIMALLGEHDARAVAVMERLTW